MTTTDSDGGYISSLAVRPHRLVPPGRPPSRWREVGAMVRWVFGSWRRPADADARWQQRSGCEHREP